jgi:NADP-dependent 3-hydroxy acid dehydrogenase YdfG
MTMALDVRDAQAWRSALASFHGTTGRLDVLLNNAGILISGPLESNALERHQAVLDVNVKGVLNGCQLAKPYLQATPGSRVINMSSAAAVYGQASLATYSASKFAVRALTEALNIEWQKDGIRVMDVMPLFVQTDMVTNMNARSIERMGVRLTAQDVASTIYAAATHRGSFGKVHWPVGFMATWLFRLTALGPDRLSRFVASRLAA